MLLLLKVLFHWLDIFVDICEDIKPLKKSHFYNNPFRFSKRFSTIHIRLCNKLDTFLCRTQNASAYSSFCDWKNAFDKFLVDWLLENPHKKLLDL